MPSTCFCRVLIWPSLASLYMKTLSAIWLRTSWVLLSEALSTGTSTPTSSTVIAIVTIAAIDGAALRRRAR